MIFFIYGVRLEPRHTPQYETHWTVQLNLIEDDYQMIKVKCFHLKQNNE